MNLDYLCSLLNLDHRDHQMDLLLHSDLPDLDFQAVLESLKLQENQQNLDLHLALQDPTDLDFLCFQETLKDQ